MSFFRSRPRDRTLDKGRKDKRDSRDRDRERERERERERRIAREEREAAREKEREEALARCQERQRERERLKELAKKEEERNRLRDRNRRDERGLDKPSNDRVERLLPLPSDRGGRSDGSGDKDSDRRRDRRERTPDRGRRKSVDRHERLGSRDLSKDRLDSSYERGYDRSNERHYDRDRDRDYGSLAPRVRDLERRHDDKNYDSPYARSRHDDRSYMDISDHYNDNSRDEHLPPLDNRDYPEEHRRRELWDERDIERDRDLEHRRYREDSRPPALKGRDWDSEYGEHEWDRNRRPLDWEGGRENWDSVDHEHSQLDEEWRHYNRSMDSWAGDDRRRWPSDWRERSRPRSSTSHREGKKLLYISFLGKYKLLFIFK